mmetsp:Transcript_27342/g.53299  ORF Transcript_27342/g.53299 Transcript_27342/m.53299 type:complete len:270 (+) Transcript_27342:1172-1981(+)
MCESCSLWAGRTGGSSGTGSTGSTMVSSSSPLCTKSNFGSRHWPTSTRLVTWTFREPLSTLRLSGGHTTWWSTGTPSTISSFGSRHSPSSSTPTRVSPTSPTPSQTRASTVPSFCLFSLLSSSPMRRPSTFLLAQTSQSTRRCSTPSLGCSRRCLGHLTLKQSSRSTASSDPSSLSPSRSFATLFSSTCSSPSSTRPTRTFSTRESTTQWLSSSETRLMATSKAFAKSSCSGGTRRWHASKPTDPPTVRPQRTWHRTPGGTSLMVRPWH